jgi:peptidyl-prolyl cis-trans isomerase SurA
MNIIKYCFFIVLASTTLIGYGQPTKGVIIDEIIAKVDDYIVLKSELEQAYLDFLSSGEINTGNAKCKVLENLVINKLMIAKAEIDSVEVDDGEVYANLDRRMQYFISQIGTEEAIEEYYGKSIADFRQELFDDIKDQMVVQKMQQEITSDVAVSPLDVKRFFKRIPRDSLPYFSTEVTVGQIVKKPTISKNQKENIKAQLAAVKNRILKGEDFGVLAKEYSMDPGSASMGGNLGFFKRGELAPQFEATALGLKPGEISDPVETMFGLHIIQLIERRGNTFNSRHILIIPESSGSDIEDAKFYLDSLRTLILADSITFSKAAKEYSDDKETATSGGFLTDVTGASMISVEAMDPILFFTIDTLKVGTISPPMNFKMEDGTEAVRILFYKDRTPPHQANLDQDYQKIQAATKAEKRNKILSEWFLKAQGDVFLSVDAEYSECELLKQAY